MTSPSRPTVARYESYGYDHGMRPAHEGEWVRYSDYESQQTALSEALSGREAAQKEVAELKEKQQDEETWWAKERDQSATITALQSANAKLTAALSERTDQANDYEQALIAESAKSSKLEAALAEARAELAESARLHGMGSEREAALLAKLDQAKRELSAEKVHHIHTAQCLREELAEASAKIEELAIGHARYEYLRKLNPRQFTELYQQNISTAVPFDTLVDEARVALAKLHAGRDGKEGKP